MINKGEIWDEVRQIRRLVSNLYVDQRPPTQTEYDSVGERMLKIVDLLYPEAKKGS